MSYSTGPIWKKVVMDDIDNIKRALAAGNGSTSHDNEKCFTPFITKRENKT